MTAQIGNASDDLTGWSWRFPVADLGIVPFLAVLPFMFVPKILDGDTQPWVLIAALIALFTYRPREFFDRRDLPIVALAALSLAALGLRTGASPEFLRAGYIFLTFTVLWILARRDRGDWFGLGVRITIGVWFAVGVYQYLATLLGIPVEITGRFVEGRGGVPSLAAEPSYYGSINIIMMMYLLHCRRSGDAIYLIMASIGVLISGSVLSLILLIFPLLLLRPGVLLMTLAGVTLLFMGDAAVNEAGVTARLASLGNPGQGVVALLIDPSLNLRFGHIAFTLYENFWRGLVMVGPINFQDEYNIFAANTGFLIFTESNFILTSGGDLVYGSGIFGAIICIILIYTASSGKINFNVKLTRSAFVFACLLNPVSIANPFLVFFCLQGVSKFWDSRKQ